QGSFQPFSTARSSMRWSPSRTRRPSKQRVPPQGWKVYREAFRQVLPLLPHSKWVHVRKWPASRSSRSFLRLQSATPRPHCSKGCKLAFLGGDARMNRRTLLVVAGALLLPRSAIPAQPIPSTPPIPVTSHAIARADYPAASFRNREEGIVTIKYVVQAN